MISRLILKRRFGFVSFKLNVTAGLAAILVTFVLYTVIILVMLFSIPEYPQIAFDKDSWQRDHENRWLMADELVESKRLIGRSREQLINLLGKPDEDRDSVIVYYIGFDKRVMLGIDPRILEIVFHNGKVVKVINRES